MLEVYVDIFFVVFSWLNVYEYVNIIDFLLESLDVFLFWEVRKYKILLVVMIILKVISGFICDILCGD